MLYSLYCVTQSCWGSARVVSVLGWHYRSGFPGLLSPHPDAFHLHNSRDIFSIYIASCFPYHSLARHLTPFFFNLSFLFLRRDTVSEKSRRRFASLLRSLVLCFSEARHSLPLPCVITVNIIRQHKSQDLYLLFVSLEVLYCSVCSKIRWTCN